METFQTDCLTLGGGVAGLASTAKVSRYIKNCILVEKNNFLAQETSSRNSEVIHAGIYYPENSLKSKLCITGKQLLYEYLQERKIKHNKCGKFILSSSDEETEKLHNLRENAINSDVKDLTFDNKAIEDYNFLLYEESLFSPSTGVFDSHKFMKSLEADIKSNDGIILVGNKVEKVEKEKESFEVLIKDVNNNIEFIIKTKIIINCLGLEAINLSNLLCEEERYKLKLLKGDYYSYSGKEKLSHLVYPLPKKLSLGAHVTIDLGRGIKFGPSAYEVNKIDYSINDSNKLAFLDSIRTYWPSVEDSQINPSYSGIRPLIEGKDDFIIERHFFDDNILIDVLGYASPGLTSSLATANYVDNLINK